MIENMEELFKWIFGFLTLVLLVVIMFFGFNVSRINDYQQNVNSILQSSGGFTSEAKNQIHSLNIRFNNNFSVVSDNNLKHGYGETISYKIKAHIPVKLYGNKTNGETTILPFNSETEGKTTSQVGMD